MQQILGRSLIAFGSSCNDFSEELISVVFLINIPILSLFKLAANVLQLPVGGNLEALQCQLSTNFDSGTMLDLSTEPPLLGGCCYVL